MNNTSENRVEKKKVLVVDDDRDILEAVEILLSMQGFAVTTHASGYHVDEVVALAHPDLILLDINLPGKKGDQICKELKQVYTTPILLFSAHANLKQCPQDCKADGYIEKPFDSNKLFRSIQALLN